MTQLSHFLSDEFSSFIESLFIDLFADTATILISIVSNSYYGMPRGQMHINLPPEHPIISFETIEIKMAAVFAKRSMRSFVLLCSSSLWKALQEWSRTEVSLHSLQP